MVHLNFVACLTTQVHSLQQLGFLLSVCHSLLLVQDWATDMNLIRLTNFLKWFGQQLIYQVASGSRDAEALDPKHGGRRERCHGTLSQSRDRSKQGKGCSLSRHGLIFDEKAEFTDMEPSRTRELEAFYSRVLSKSRLQWKQLGAAAGARDGGLKPHLVCVADMEGEREEVLAKRHSPDRR